MNYEWGVEDVCITRYPVILFERSYKKGICMIDFNKDTVIKLSPIAPTDLMPTIASFLVTGEEAVMVFKTVRDQVVFTNKRIIATNVQGLIGKKIDYTSVPYRKINMFSVITAALLDLSCELELSISEVGKIRFEINGSFDIVKLNRVISEYVL